MGRALLITCLGSFIILGMVQQAVQQRQLTMTEGNVETFSISHAQNATNSGLELGLQRIFHDDNWEDYGNPWVFPIDDMDVQVWVDSNSDYPEVVPPNYYRIRSEYQVGSRTLLSFAYLKDDVITPPVHGAVGYYGDDEEARIYMTGNADIYGHDTNPSSHPVAGDGPGPHLPAITSEIEEDILIEQKGNSSYQGEPDYVQQELDGHELNERVAMYEQQKDPYYNPADLGTPENPKITVLEENEKLTENTNAAGILIVKEGATLELRGTFSFEGLVIVQGTLDIKGNVKIFGAMMFTDNALLEIEDEQEGDFSGNTEIYYSSEALRNINNFLSHRFDGTGLVVDRIFY